LAHKAVYEGHVVAEVIAGHKALFDPMTIPSVVYTDLEVVWMGLTETEANEKGIEIEKGVPGDWKRKSIQGLTPGKAFLNFCVTCYKNEVGREPAITRRLTG